MKKLLGIIVLGLLLSGNANAGINEPGFFIGEVMDVTGHLGGYNFQWAWSSGFVAGQYA